MYADSTANFQFSSVQSYPVLISNSKFNTLEGSISQYKQRKKSIFFLKNKIDK